jgi:hypothetical protein
MKEDEEQLQLSIGNVHPGQEVKIEITLYRQL